MNGVLLIDKPDGWTSFDVVGYTRKIVAELVGKKPRNVKVGHTGTLDPAATGLLVVCVGKATKTVPTLIKVDKTYDVEMTLGYESTTGDREGELKAISDMQPAQSDIESVLTSFVGEQLQTPPKYSALKIGGVRAYDLARQGKEVPLAPRPITINSIIFTSYDYPHVRFVADVGSGTYIRSLVEDIGKKLGCGAYMSNLRRTRVGEFSIDTALQVDDLNKESLQKLLDIND